MREKIRKILENAVGSEVDYEVVPSSHPSQGHYSTNLAMRHGRLIRQNPLNLAEDFTERIKTSAPPDFFEKIETAGPGFINFWLTPKALQEELSGIIGQGQKMLQSEAGRNKTVIVEYSSPNIAKPMHVGHLRNTVLGDVLANMFQAAGYKVVRWNYIGDWGTQFGKLITAYKLWGNKEEIEKDPIEKLLALYVRFHEEVKEHPELEEQAREEFRKLETGDKESRKIWGWFKKESMREFNKAYHVLGTAFDINIGESFFENDLPVVISELAEKGLARESEGGLIVDLAQFNLPVGLVRKSDGASLYLTRDIANLKYRLREYKPDKVVYVVGNEQSLHLAQVFAVGELLGLLSGGKPELVHMKYGLVLGEAGKRFSTREGNIISAEEVLQKALGLARGIVKDKNPGFSRKEQEEIAQAVAVGALKYTNLKENRNSDIVFDWQKMLDFGGDSAPYLQYTYARLKSVLRKAGRLSELRGRWDLSALTDERELALIRAIGELPHALRSARENMAPNLVCSYLYELANVTNRFYESCQILKDQNAPRRRARLVLIKVASETIAAGLKILGISAPERI